MSLWQSLIFLTLVESVALLLAGLIWRDRIAGLALRLLGLGSHDPTSDQYAERLADAFRRVKWIKEKSTQDAAGANVAPYEQAIDCLQHAGETFRAHPGPSAHYGEPLLRGCELLAQSLERQMTAVDASQAGAAVKSDPQPDPPSKEEDLPPDSTSKAEPAS